MHDYVTPYHSNLFRLSLKNNVAPADGVYLY